VLILKQFGNNFVTLVAVSLNHLGLKMQQRLRKSVLFWAILTLIHGLGGCWADAVELKETPASQESGAALDGEKGDDSSETDAKVNEAKKQTSPLVISVEKLRPGKEKDQVCFLLFDASVAFTYGFDEKAIHSGCVLIKGTPAPPVVANLNLEVGKKYMVFVFHDEEKGLSRVNSKLDYIEMKIPSEGMGLSNNPKADRPTYGDAEFTHSAEVDKMQINIRYIF